MNSDVQTIALVGGALASAFGLVRLSFALHRTTAERFMEFLDKSLRQQEAANARLADALDKLSETSRENNTLLRRMSDEALASQRKPNGRAAQVKNGVRAI